MEPAPNLLRLFSFKIFYVLSDREELNTYEKRLKGIKDIFSPGVYEIKKLRTRAFAPTRAQVNTNLTQSKHYESTHVGELYVVQYITYV